jgi:hypothetical protein
LSKNTPGLGGVAITAVAVTFEEPQRHERVEEVVGPSPAEPGPITDLLPGERFGAEMGEQLKFHR